MAQELKADKTFVFGEECEAYKKSEADKVIAELKNEIEEQKRLRDMALASVPNVLKVMKIIQHHKYKRCVELADSCALRTVVAKMENRRFPTPKNSWRMFIYPKWHKRWLAIAEKFKEAK